MPHPFPEKCSCLFARLLLFQAQNQGHKIRKDRESVNGSSGAAEGFPLHTRGAGSPGTGITPHPVAQTLRQYELCPPLVVLGDLYRGKGTLRLCTGGCKDRDGGNGPPSRPASSPAMTQRGAAALRS